MKTKTIHTSLFLVLCITLFTGASDFIEGIKRSPCRMRHRGNSHGAYSYGQPHVIWGQANYSVGKFCSIAANVTFMLGGNHRVDWISTYPFTAFAQQFPKAANIPGHPSTKGDIIIKNDVWIGMNVTILSGVTVEDGAVIGMNSTVAKNIPAYAIAVGNPARVVRYRFDQETIARLLKLKWWDWPIDRIKKNVQYLCSNDMKTFLALNEEKKRGRP